MEHKHITFANELTEYVRHSEHAGSQRLKLIIHAGTPKTGSTSLQVYLGKKQRKLREIGVLYPHNIEKLTNPSAPKHQWLEKNLVSTHLDYFLENFKNIVSQVKDHTHTIILSSEGIYNYWWDFPDESKAILGELAKLFDVEIWVWFREPVAFAQSYYKQCIRNPQINGNPCYGKDLSLSEMLDIDWFSQHLNYQEFVTDCQALFGERNVLAYEYKGDVVQEVIHFLGLATPHDNPTSRQNESLNNASIALLRIINRTNISAKDKQQLMPHLKNIDEILTSYENPSLVDEDARRKILQTAKPIQF